MHYHDFHRVQYGVLDQMPFGLFERLFKIVPHVGIFLIFSHLV
jgi:hypothetical protein